MIEGKTDLMTVLARLRKARLDDMGDFTPEFFEQQSNEAMLAVAVDLIVGAAKHNVQSETNYAILGATAMLVAFMEKNGTGTPSVIDASITEGAKPN